MQYLAYGLIDNSLLCDLRPAFLKKRYAVQSQNKQQHSDLKTDFTKEASEAKTVFEFDRLIRGPILGFKSSHTLWRHISCDRFLPHVDVPFMTVVSKDDPITAFRHVPVETLQRNPNCLLTVFEVGGHVEFFTEATKTQSKDSTSTQYQRSSPGFALAFLD
jgi:predicted alpha/beta-fold hydrolase